MGSNKLLTDSIKIQQDLAHCNNGWKISEPQFNKCEAIHLGGEKYQNMKIDKVTQIGQHHT